MKNELLLMLLFVLIGIAGGNVTVVVQPLEPTGQGGNEVNSVLTADINLCHSDYPDLMIGTESRPFCDIFDGGNHTVTYNYENVTEKRRGLFAFVKDATIRNLRVEGNSYVTQIHYGALMGRADGTVLVENVITNVDITGAINGVTGDAGVIGANYANLTFNNCAIRRCIPTMPVCR